MARNVSAAHALIDFITNNYSKMVVEVGCGRFSVVAIALRPFFAVTATDILEIDAIDKQLMPIYIKDDVTCPVLSVYRGASLIFAIRPPLDIQPSILALSELVGADALVTPFSAEIIEDSRLALRNFRGTPLYLFRNKQKNVK